MAKSDSIHQGLHESLRDQLRPPAVDFDAMSDDEIIAFLANQTESDKYAIPKHIIPDGMAYQWMSGEIYGKPDHKRLAEAEMNGWRAVPQSRHDGLYMAPGTTGPIIVDGSMLHEIPARVLKLKRELAARVAANKVQDMNNQLIYAPPGTAPRDAHPKTRPVVHRERAVSEVLVE